MFHLSLNLNLFLKHQLNHRLNYSGNQFCYLFTVIVQNFLIISDYLGRKRTVILGAISSAFAIFCYALGFSFWVLILGAIFEGLSRAFYSGNNEALLHETLADEGKAEEYHTYHGRIHGMFQVALAVSALIGGFLASISLPLVFWLSIIPQILCFILALSLIEPKSVTRASSNIYIHLSESIKYFIKNPKLRLLSLSSIWGYGFGEVAFQFRSAYVISVWPVWTLSISQMLANIGATIGFFSAGKFISRFGAIKMFFAGGIFDRVADIIALTFSSVLSPIIMSTTSLFFGIGTTAKSTLFQKEFTNEQRSTMGSLNSFAGSVFFAIVAYFVGFFADKLSPREALLFMQFFQMFGIYINWRLLKHK